MPAFEVKDMTCGHCVSTITKAVKATDAQATVTIDLSTHRVEVTSATVDDKRIGEAIAEAGFTPQVLT